MSKRRKWSAEEKLRIVLAGMQPGVEVSDLCRQEGINPTMYYYWKKKLLGSAKQLLLFLYNSGARADEAAHVLIGDLQLGLKPERDP